MFLLIPILTLASLGTMFLMMFYLRKFGVVKSKRDVEYRQRDMMTGTESQFFQRLVVALPGHYVFPKVPVSALLEPAEIVKAHIFNGRTGFSGKRIGYVVCDAKLSVLALIELNFRVQTSSPDRSHDMRLKRAGIRTLRFSSRNLPTVAQIQDAVLRTRIADTPSVSLDDNVVILKSEPAGRR